MYIFPDMIDLGLKDGQEWPSPEHRQVAQNLALGKPSIKDRDRLTEVVQEVLTTPSEKIKTATIADFPISASIIGIEIQC